MTDLLISLSAITVTAAAVTGWAHIASTRHHQIHRHFHPAEPPSLEHPTSAVG